MSNGFFIVLEGGEAAGKSTQARILGRSLDAVVSREPGGTELGARMREILLSRETVGLVSRAEALLMAADRAQHVEELVRPAVLSGRHVIADRHSGSFIAYQGYGRGLDIAEVTHITQWATGGFQPDLVVLIDVDPGHAATRRAEAHHDRLDAEDAAFHNRVANGFRELAAADPQRWVVVDGNGTVNEVHHRIRDAVRDRLAI